MARQVDHFPWVYRVPPILVLRAWVPGVVALLLINKSQYLAQAPNNFDLITISYQAKTSDGSKELTSSLQIL